MRSERGWETGSRVAGPGPQRSLLRGLLRRLPVLALAILTGCLATDARAGAANSDRPPADQPAGPSGASPWQVITISASGVTIDECAARLTSEVEIAVNKQIIAELAERGLADQMDLPATTTDLSKVDVKTVGSRKLEDGRVEQTIQVTFGDRFQAHIAQRIRQQQLQQRLAWTGIVSGGSLLGLAFLWGSLRFALRRRAGSMRPAEFV